MRRVASWSLALGLLVTAAACAPVRPWERETLAAPGLRQPPRPLVHREVSHIANVREASRGGDGSVGGGCGCN